MFKSLVIAAICALAPAIADAQTPPRPPPTLPAVVIGDPGPNGVRIDTAGVFANFFAAKQPGDRPAILLLGGSEGGLPSRRAAWLGTCLAMCITPILEPRAGGVDLDRADTASAGARRSRLHLVYRLRFQWVLRLRWIGAMVGYSQDSARFECAIESLEIVFRVAVRKPVVNVAKSQNHISRAHGGDFSLVRRLERSYDHRTIIRGVGLELLREGRRARSPSHRFVKLAMVFEKGRQDLGIPTVPGPDLDHRHIGLDPKEGERFQGMAIFVAGLVGLGTLRSANCSPKRGHGAGVILGRRRGGHR